MGEHVESSATQPFCGPREPLRRLAIVRAGTVVVVWPPHAPPLLRRPGDLLLPGRPLAAPVQVMPVTTASVDLVVTLSDLTTADREVITEVDVQLRVQLDPAEQFAAVLELAAEHGGQLGAVLIQQVLEAVEGAVHAAVRMNRLADLRRLTLTEVLGARWLPSGYAGGRLRQLAVAVPRVRWPDSPDPNQPPTPARPSAPSAPAHPPGPGLTLSMDRQLRRIWRAVSDAEPVGIAGARVGDHATVVVVLPQAPRAYETSRVREEFIDHFGTAEVSVVPVVADDYPTLVGAWFTALDLGPPGAVSVTLDDGGGALTVHLDHPVPRGVGPGSGWQGTEGSQVEALRHLLPFRAIWLSFGSELA